MKKLVIALFMFFVMVVSANAADILDKVYSLQLDGRVYSISFTLTPFSGGNGCASGTAILEDSNGNTFNYSYDYYCECKYGFLGEFFFRVDGNTLQIYNKILEFEEVE